MRRRAIVLLLASLFRCAAPEPVKAKAPAAPTDADARAALQQAAGKNSADAYFDVFNRFPKLPSGKEAMRRGARMLVEQSKKFASECDQPSARGVLARVAPFTLEDTEVNEAYDEMQRRLLEDEARCQLVTLDKDIKQLAADWDWPGVFDRIQSTRDVEGALLRERRLAAQNQWKKFVDQRLREMVGGARPDAAKRQLLEASVDAVRMPAELTEDIQHKWAPAMHAALTLFLDCERSELLSPSKRFWAYGTAHTRLLDSPKAMTGPELANGTSFLAIGTCQLGGENLLLAGAGATDVVLRLQGAKLFVNEAECKPYDTSKLRGN